MNDRRFPRVPLDTLAFLESDRESGHGALLNLSQTGGKLSTAYTIQPRGYVSLNLSLPFREPSPQVIQAAVHLVQGKQFGVEFVQIAEAEQARLRAFLDDHPPAKMRP